MSIRGGRGVGKTTLILQYIKQHYKADNSVLYVSLDDLYSYLKKLLKIVSSSIPFKPNMKSLSERIGISLNTMKAYLKLLDDAEMLRMLYVKDKGINSLNKPEKIYLNNSNLMNALVGSADIGNVHETFFFNQVKNSYTVNASKVYNFLVEDRYIFEIGGKNKKQKQIRDLQNAFVVKDGIEIGSDNTIPLWLFGFLY